MSYQKKDSVIGGEFLLFDIDSDKIFTMEDFDSDQRMMAESCSDFLEREVIPLTDKIDSKKFSVYLRLDVKDKHGILSDITKVMAKNQVSIKRLIQNPTENKKNASIIVITHDAKSSSLERVLSVLKKKKYLISNPKLIRIEEI